MQRFFITFSPRYRTESHPVAEVEPDGYVCVEAESYSEALIRAYEVFSAYFEDVIPESEFDESRYSLGMFYSI